MLPVFNEYISFLKNNNVDLNLTEGYYWLDKTIIKAYGKSGVLHKIARIHIDDNLNVTATKYKIDIKDEKGKKKKVHIDPGFN